MAFGVGTLISSIAFELVEPALTLVDGPAVLVVGLLAGSVVFFLGDRAMASAWARRGDANAARPTVPTGGSRHRAGHGPRWRARVGRPGHVPRERSTASGWRCSAAIWVSNVPESLGATRGHARRRVGRGPGSAAVWWGIVAVSAWRGGPRLRAREGHRSSTGSRRPGLRGRRAPDDDRRRDGPRGLRTERSCTPASPRQPGSWRRSWSRPWSSSVRPMIASRPRSRSTARTCAGASSAITRSSRRDSEQGFDVGCGAAARVATS